MIYLCSPCKLCDQVAKLKRSIGCRKPSFPQKPTCTFVIVSAGLSFAHLFNCFVALDFASSECKDGEPGVLLGFQKFLHIQIAFAVLSLIFALYFLKRVWSRILKLTGTDGFEAEDLQPAPDQKYRMIRISHRTIRQGFKDVVKFDMVVLLYFFACLGILVLSFFSPTRITHMADCPHASEVRSLGMTFFWVDALWVPIWWYCCSFKKGVVAEIPWNKTEPGIVVGVAISKV